MRRLASIQLCPKVSYCVVVNVWKVSTHIHKHGEAMTQVWSVAVKVGNRITRRTTDVIKVLSFTIMLSVPGTSFGLSIVPVDLPANSQGPNSKHQN